MSILNAAEDRRELPFVTAGWQPSSDADDDAERRSISALCRFTGTDAVLEARLQETCEKHVRNWSGREIPMPRKRNRATLESVLASLGDLSRLGR